MTTVGRRSLSCESPHLSPSTMKSMSFEPWIPKKDGIFAFTTGDIGSLNAKFRKHKWRMIHPPTHLHYFSKTSIEKILTSQGFKILDIKYPAVYRTFDNIIYNLFVLRNNSPWVYKICKSFGITKLSFKINLFDIMLVVAQKE